MSKKNSGPKLIAAALIIIVGGAAAFGYMKQSSNLGGDEAKLEDVKPAEATAKIDTALLTVKPSDIILGDANAPVTIVEYASLSCSHCAHFHETVLPDLQKQFITTGKVRLVLRHFPLNAPALKGAELVECAGRDGKERASFAKVLFDMQSKWAFDENYVNNLKQIASVGGIDSAAFDSCMADKALEDEILNDRKEAQEKLAVDSTPMFFINNVKFEGERTPEAFAKAINAEINGKKE